MVVVVLADLPGLHEVCVRVIMLWSLLKVIFLVHCLIGKLNELRICVCFVFTNGLIVSF